MNLMVRNIRPGYCEVWANRWPGGRYELAAKVRRMDDGWRWVSMSVSVVPDHIRPLFQTRGECVTDCKRTALLYLAEQAIEIERAHPTRRLHKHRPTRDALHSMRESGCFSIAEVEEMAERMGLK